MADLLYTSAEEYSTPDYIYRGKPGTKLNTSLSLGASKRRFIKKIGLPMFQIVVSEQDRTAIVGISNLYVATAATKQRFVRKTFVASLTPEVWEVPVKSLKKTRSIDITISPASEIAGELTADTSVTPSAEVLFLSKRVKNAAIVATAEKTKFIKKTIQATFSVSAYQGAEYLATVDNFFTVTSNKKKDVKKVIDVPISLSAFSEVEKGKIYSFDVTLDLASYATHGNRRVRDVSLAISSAARKRINKGLRADTAIYADKTKHVSKTESAYFSLSSLPARTTEGIADGTITIFSEKNKAIRKNLSASVVLAGHSEQETGQKYSASMFLTVDATTVIRKNLSASLSLSANITKGVAKQLSSDVTITGKSDQGNEQIFYGDISLSADTTVSISKELSTDLSLSADIAKAISKTLSSSVTITGQAEQSGGQIFTASLSLAADAYAFVKKLLSSYLNISSTGEEEIGKKYTLISLLSISAGKVAKLINRVLAPSGGDEIAVSATKPMKMIKKTFSVSLNMSAWESEEAKKYEETFATLFLVAAKVEKIVKKTIDSDVSLYASVAGGGKLTANVSISLVPSIQITMSNKILIDTWITIIEQKPAKRIGKTFKIREHAPSVWHSWGC